MCLQWLSSAVEAQQPLLQQHNRSGSAGRGWSRAQGQETLPSN